MRVCTDRASQLCADGGSFGEKQSNVPVELQTLLSELETGQSLGADGQAEIEGDTFDL